MTASPSPAYNGVLPLPQPRDGRQADVIRRRRARRRALASARQARQHMSIAVFR